MERTDQGQGQILLPLPLTRRRSTGLCSSAHQSPDWLAPAGHRTLPLSTHSNPTTNLQYYHRITPKRTQWWIQASSPAQTNLNWTGLDIINAVLALFPDNSCSPCTVLAAGWSFWWFLETASPSRHGGLCSERPDVLRRSSAPHHLHQVTEKWKLDVGVSFGVTGGKGPPVIHTLKVAQPPASSPSLSSSWLPSWRGSSHHCIIVSAT